MRSAQKVVGGQALAPTELLPQRGSPRHMSEIWAPDRHQCLRTDRASDCELTCAPLHSGPHRSVEVRSVRSCGRCHIHRFVVARGQRSGPCKVYQNRDSPGSHRLLDVACLEVVNDRPLASSVGRSACQPQLRSHSFADEVCCVADTASDALTRKSRSLPSLVVRPFSTALARCVLVGLHAQRQWPDDRHHVGWPAQGRQEGRQKRVKLHTARRSG